MHGYRSFTFALLLGIVGAAFADADPDGAAIAAAAQVRSGNAADFFDDSFLELPEELALVADQGKRGLLIMFENAQCPFCRRMKRTVLNRSDVQAYFRRHFRIISVDTEGDGELIDVDGSPTTEKAFALKRFRVRATPVFLVVDAAGNALKNGRMTGATKNADEFLSFGRFIVDGDNERMSFSRYKRQHRQLGGGSGGG